MNPSQIHYQAIHTAVYLLSQAREVREFAERDNTVENYEYTMHCETGSVCE